MTQGGYSILCLIMRSAGRGDAGRFGIVRMITYLVHRDLTPSAHIPNDKKSIIQLYSRGELIVVLLISHVRD